MAIYGLAAVACLLSACRPDYPWGLAPALIGLAALVLWAATLAPRRVVGRVSIGELFESYAMKSEPVEEARETGGLPDRDGVDGLVLALVGAPPLRRPA